MKKNIIAHPDTICNGVVLISNNRQILVIKNIVIALKKDID